MSRRTFLLGYTHTMRKLAAIDPDEFYRRFENLSKDPGKLHNLINNGGMDAVFSHIGVSEDDLRKILEKEGVPYDAFKQSMNTAGEQWKNTFGHMTAEEFAAQHGGTVGDSFKNTFNERMPKAKGGGGGMKGALIAGGIGAATAAGIGITNYLASKRRRDELARRRAV